MATPQHHAPPTGEIIEPDDGIPGTTTDNLNYEAQKQYWFRACPGGVLIPPALAPYPEQHYAFLQSHSPSFALFCQQQARRVDGAPVDAPVEPDTAPGYHHQATQADKTPIVAREPPAEGLQFGVPHPSQSPGSTTTASSTPSEKASTTVSTCPTPDGRKRCEVWPMTYRCANGWLNTFWCVRIDGESQYQYKPPNLEELSRKYHLVYFP